MDIENAVNQNTANLSIIIEVTNQMIAFHFCRETFNRYNHETFKTLLNSIIGKDETCYADSSSIPHFL